MVPARPHKPSDAGSNPVPATSLMEIWLSGLRHSPAKGERVNSSVGSNPTISAQGGKGDACKGAFLSCGDFVKEYDPIP